ncbi:MAG TPA: NADH-quinone oxidoreductase subunit L [Chryseolinea sp.]|nr:NADH-quinone oxidoreductase subunit L [Chryseolinea sp.]
MISATTLSFDVLVTGVLPALLLPLLSAVACLLVREKYAWLVAFLSPVFILLSLAAAAFTWVSVWGAAPAGFSVPWFCIGGKVFEVSFLLNNTSVLMMLVVTAVSFLVHVYSIGYMADDAAQGRYFCMLGLFTFAMLGIVVTGNLLVLFMFWELVGFSSYMLIGHWHEKPEAADAAKRAFLFNRVGDAGFVVALMAVWSAYGTFNFVDIDPASATQGWRTVAGIGLFCGVIGKSAQFPLFGWLPKAMEGPTPVSALIHAATMVAAGVYLLDRVFWLFVPPVLGLMAIIGAITAVAGALAALGQFDMKRILAYSTVSQLGLMVMAVGTGAPSAAMLHLVAHAFFKAGLFLAAGCVIHSLHQSQHHSHNSFDVQDIRNLGGLWARLPLTFIAFVLCGSALAGIPFFAGFLSKEAILEAVLGWAGDSFSWRWTIAASAMIVSFLTPLYTFRLIWKIFMGPEQFTQSLTVGESPPVMRAAIVVLSIASLWPVISYHPFDFNSWIFSGLGGTTQHELPWLGLASVVWISLALGLAYLRRERNVQAPLLLEAFYFDILISRSVEAPALKISAGMQRIDKRWIDGALHAVAYAYTIIAHVAGWFDRIIVDGLVDGIAWSAKMVGYWARRFQRDGVQLYVFWAVFAIIIFIIWTVL